MKIVEAMDNRDRDILGRILARNTTVEEFIVMLWIVYDESCSVHLNNVLMRSGIGTLREMLASEWSRLAGVAGCGRSTLSEWRGILARLGLSMKGVFPFKGISSDEPS